MKNLKNKKITKATVKKFIRENQENLFINFKSAFDGMTDVVEQNKNSVFEKAQVDTKRIEYTLGVVGAWFVGSSRDCFKYYENERFVGIEVYNCCGCFILAIKK